MKPFSQRKGLKPVSEVIQIDSMNSELRNSLWNTLTVELWLRDQSLNHHLIELFSEALWSDFFKKPIDSRRRESLTETPSLFPKASSLLLRRCRITT